MCPTLPRLVLTAVFVLGASLATAFDQVEWLQEVTAPPKDPVLEATGTIASLLAENNESPATLESWQSQRHVLRERWLEFLGPMPGQTPLDMRTIRSEQVDNVERRLVEYAGEPGLRVQGYLLLPSHRTPLPNGAAASGRRPGILALHETTRATIDDIAGVSGHPSMQLGLKLARRGFVVFCPRCFLWQDATTLDDAVQAHRRRHPRTLGMAKMLFDASRGVDLLRSLEEVDPDRIGSIGHSLGAKEVLYLAAFDERVRASVASEGGLGFRSTNWDAPWYLGPAIRDPDFPLNHHQLLALAAPRPLLIVGGEAGPGAADGDRSWVLLEAALPVWKLYPGPVRLGLLNHHQGHSIPDAAFERMAEWLRVSLGP